MADQKISDLTALTGASVADTDVLPIVDTSASVTKKVTIDEFNKRTQDGVDIDGGAIDGTPIGGTAPSTGAFSTVSATGLITASSGISFGDDTLDTYKGLAGFTAKIADLQSGGNESPTGLTATYSKVGNIVFMSIRAINIDTTGMTGGNQLWITGLPEPLSTINFGGGDIYTSQVTYNGSLVIVPAVGSSELRFGEQQSASPIGFLTVSDLASGSADIFLNMWYWA